MDEINFAKSMDLLADIYRGKFALRPDDRKEVQNRIYESWYRYFKEFEDGSMEMAIDEWVKAETKAPTITELIPKCQKYSRQIKKELERIKQNEGLQKRDPDSIEDYEAHPYEDGWRINDDGYWIQINV